MKMDKTNRTDLHRLFLFENLPEPLTRASSHLQIFDNYISNTRMRIRSVRIPETKAWTWILQQRFPERAGDFTTWKLAEIYLNEAEHAALEHLEGREIRKNRYFHEYDGKEFAFDVFLGALWGLNIVRVDFADIREMKVFEPPPFAAIEVSHLPMFSGENLVEKTFDQVRDEFARTEHVIPDLPDE